MQIKIVASAPAAKPGVLTAVLDLAPARTLAAPASLKAHPAAADLERRAGQASIDCPYLAVGEAPLLYLPARAARFWDDDEKVRSLAATAYDVASDRQDALTVLLDGPQGAAAAPLVAEGLALRDYRFLKYKPAAAPAKELAVTLVVPTQSLTAVKASVAARLQLVASVNRARDLINEPANVATPAEIETRARAVARAGRLQIDVLDAKALARQGYNGLPTVGKGGNVPPRMIILRHKPRGAVKGVHLGLLGKGLTFDNGGVSIKPADKMWTMKGDMSGAAAVLYAIENIAARKLPIAVTAIIVTAQNYVDANSMMPGDIFVAKNGKSVHVDNTDAEGRLILSDGLCRMGEEGVTHLVDVATLTGACMRALGDRVSGVFGNDDFADTVSAAAATQGEACWRLPLVEEYAERLKFEITDLNNMATKPLMAGATIAALFLREFVPENVHWAHLDIAGTFIVDGSTRYYRPGPTGVMVRSLSALAEKMANGV